jgi:hypothetical protein
MSRVTAFTSATLGYLDRATVLRASLAHFHPDWQLVLVLVDELPHDERLLDQLARFDRVIVAAEFRGADFRRWVFGHDVVEACTAVKGAATAYLLDHTKGPVVYLDPDMMVFAPLDPVLDALSRGGVALTPHVLTPQRGEQAIQENELGPLKHGVYNLGFLAVSPEGSGPRFARWMKARLDRFCIDDPASGLFTDQRIMDHAPVFFPDTVVIRDPGTNVASWNLAEREIGLSDEGDYLCNGQPLRLYHFTKALGAGPYRETLRWGAGNVHVAEIWRYYLEELRAAQDQMPAPPPWAYARYYDGDEIPLGDRRAYRQDSSLQRRWTDPFAIPAHERPGRAG